MCGGKSLFNCFRSGLSNRVKATSFGEVNLILSYNLNKTALKLKSGWALNVVVI